MWAKTALVLSVAAILYCLWWHPTVPSDRTLISKPPPPTHRTPSEVALGEARMLWGRALLEVKPQMEALLEWDPKACDRMDQEALRRELMAHSQAALLDRARCASRRALNHARTSDERFDATFWLALLDCESGRHREELVQVHRLMSLQPRHVLSLGSLRRAAWCNHLPGLVQKVEAELSKLPVTHPTPVR
jgi:hypothetical protein